MSVIWILVYLLAAAAPGVALLRALAEPEPRPATWALGATLGLFLVPLVTFGAAMAMHTHVTRGLLLAVSATLTLLPWLLHRALRHP